MAMDGIRKIARDYYERASEEEKNKAYSFFRRIDVNGDGKISFQELKAYMPTTDEKLFRQFDASGDGTLDFDEAVALYYTSKKTTFRRCSVCQDLLMGSFFSCLPCHDNIFPNTFNLCIDCYCGGEFKHEHDRTNFLDHHDLLHVYGKRNSSDAHKREEKKAGKEAGLREIARAYYERASEEEKSIVNSSFEIIDADGDGIITLQEFKEASFGSEFEDRKVFRMVDANGNGTLDFDDVLLLYYISEKSSAQVCDGASCGDLLMGPYFTCLPCHSVEDTYDLCCDCYSRGKFKHEHDLSNFFDNHALLSRYRLNRLDKTHVSRSSTTTDKIKIAKKIVRAGTHIANVVSQHDLDYGDIASDIKDAVSDIRDAVSDFDCTIM